MKGATTMAETATQTRTAGNGRGEATRQGFYFTPRVDIYETENELTLYADVPGVKADCVDLRFERGELIVQARVQHHDRPGQVLMAEYDEGDFYRVFQIHESIDSTRISAECKNGVLIVHLPKAEAAKPRQVQVKGE
jgi:HSP20 family molecular chaperone IbpA